MAILYAKAAGGNWSAAGTWSITSSAGADNSGPPLASTDVIFELASGAVTIDAASVCRSLDCTSGTGTYAGTITHNAFTLTIGDSTAGAGNIALKLRGTYTLINATTSAISFISTSSTQQTIDVGGKTTGNITINGAGSNYQLADNITGAAAWTYTAGTTFDANSKTITSTQSTTTFAGGGKTYFSVILSGAAVATISGTNTFTNLTRTGSASKTNTLTLSANQTVTGINMPTFTGNSVTNRLLITSDTRGTQRTITNTSITPAVTNCDFEDIKLNSAVDLSAISGNSGDCGGNSGITFTLPANQFLKTGASANWSAGNWFTTSGGSTPGRVPLPQDTAKIDANSITTGSLTITQDMPRVGAIDWTGVTNSPTFSLPGSITIYGGATYSTGATYSGIFFLRHVTRSTITITSNGASSSWSTRVDAPGGTVTLADALTTTGSLFHDQGTLTASNVNVTIGSSFSSSNSNTRALNMGSGTWMFNGSGGGFAWFMATTTGLTLNPETSTIKLADTSNIDCAFSGGGSTFNKVWFSRGGSTANITVSGSNTFADFKDDGTAAHSILFTDGTTTTTTTFTVSGSAGNLITINSTSTASHSLVKSGTGFISCDYLNIQHSVAAPTNTWYAGTHSTNNQATTTAGSGWLFSALQTSMDSPVFSDSFARLITSGRIISDTPSLTAPFSRNVTNSRILSDSLALTAPFSRNVTNSRILSDSLALTDPFSINIIAARSLIDSSAFNDVDNRTLVSIRTLSDVSTTVDSLARVLVTIYTSTDSPTFTDASTYRAIDFRLLTDNPLSTDISTEVSFGNRIISDVSLATDLFERSVANICSLNDTTIFSDILTTSVLIVRSLSDNSLSSDIETRTILLFRGLVDTQISIDSTDIIDDENRNLTDTFVFDDSSTIFVSILKTIDDNPTVSDSLTQSIILNLFLTDSPTCTDGISNVSVLYGLLPDSPIFSDILIDSKNIMRLITDAPNVVYGTNRLFVGSRTFVDTLSTLDSVSKLNIVSAIFFGCGF